MTALHEAAKQALQWAANHGEPVFFGGGMSAVDAMNAWTSALRKALETEHQGDQVYQMQRADGSWVDQDKQAFDYNTAHKWPTRIVYTRPQPAQQPTHWISDTSVCGSPHTVSDEMYQRGRKAGAYEGYTPMSAGPQPARQPLTDARIDELIEEGVFGCNPYELVRRLEDECGVFKTKPLTDEQRRQIWRDSQFRGNGGQIDWFIEGTRAAERAHGIGGEA